MSAFVAFNCFTLDLGNGIHHLQTDVLKVYLTNVAPALTDTVYNTPADLATGGGYVAGGMSLGANTWSQLNGLAGLAAGVNPLTFTATTGFGPFRWAILYNFTAAAKNLIAYYDNGSPVTIAAAGTFDVTFNPQVFTLDF